MTEKRMFEFSEGTSNKFWEVWREGQQVFTRYGKIGAEGQITVKDEGDEAKATKLHEKLIGEKTRKGYIEKTGTGPIATAQKAKAAAPTAAPTGDLAALEQKLLANRDDTRTWLVYADALQAKGDVRGEVIALGEQIRGKSDAKLEALYAQKCRAARWPAGAPFPKMHYKVRFQQLIAELKANKEIEVKEAKIEKPTKPKDLEKWKAVAGAHWPEGMDDLYNELSGVHIEWTAPNLSEVNGRISIPSIDLWDHDALEDELWFDFTEEGTALHLIRPIDRFVPEAYTVLYLPPGKPSQVAYHYCGEELVPTCLSYREWLEQLFRSRGVLYWVQHATGKPGNGWVTEGINDLAKMFPDFDPKSMVSKKKYKEIPLDEE